MGKHLKNERGQVMGQQSCSGNKVAGLSQMHCQRDFTGEKTSLVPPMCHSVNSDRVRGRLTVGP